MSGETFKSLKKRAGGRKPNADDVAKSKLFKEDPAKIIKDDKTVKFARTRFLKKGSPQKKTKKFGES